MKYVVEVCDGELKRLGQSKCLPAGMENPNTFSHGQIGRTPLG